MPYVQHQMLGRGIGFNALVVAVSAAVGPTLAAGILATATWPFLFAVNIPFGVAALVIGMRALPHTPRSRHAFDWQSALMSAIMFGLGIAETGRSLGVRRRYPPVLIDARYTDPVGR